MMRYGSSFAKKSYAGNGGYGGVALSGSPVVAPVGVASSEATRPSRYDPNSPSRPVSSRNPGSRYNPELEIESQAFTEEPRSKQSGSRYSGSRYNASQGQQVRPRSMDTSKKESAYSYSMSSGIELASTNPNTASGYYSRTNKWRSHSLTNMSAEHYENYSGASTRPPFWKSQKSKFTNNSPAQSQGMKKTTPSPTLPSGRFNRYSGSSSVRESSDESESMTEKNESDNRMDNPHSLGSSLINSVVETTRKVEQQHAVDHKRIDIDKLTSLRSKESTKTPEDEEKKNEVTKQPEKEAVKPLKKTSSEMWSSEYTVKKQKEVLEDNVEKQQTDELVFHNEPSKLHDNYEFIYEPNLLKTDLRKLQIHETVAAYDIPKKPLDECIFPLSKAETRLWELKNQPRDRIIEKQKYLLRTPIKNINSYPFIQQNLLIHKQAVRTLLCRKIAAIKKYEHLRKLQLRKEALDLQSIWDRNCKQMDEMSKKMRREELELKRQEELKEQEREMNEKRMSDEGSRISGSSRRRNRADFVDDAEIENVLLQIDPDYKHHQQAADIPPMIINPIERFSLRLQDVNNLVTNKDSWASRVMKDGVDTFTQNEHDLFVEGYLTYPKKFGKISQFMGALRSPEECVLHYYRTKNSVGYKKLLIDKNKKRQRGATAKRRKKKEKSNEVDAAVSIPASETEVKEQYAQDNIEPADVTPIEDKISVGTDGKSFKQMEQIEIKIPKVQKTSHISNVTLERQDTTIEFEEPEGDQKDEEVLTQGDDADNADQKSYPPSPLPEKLIVDSSVVRKRPHESTDNLSDAEKTVLEEHVHNGRTSATHEQPSIAQEYTDQSGESRFGDGVNEEILNRKRHKSSTDHKSSYWSVKEANLFPELLTQFGSQWSLISERLGTKSTTMVRNYYQRNAAQLGWKSIVEEADFRRNATSSGSVQQSQILIQAEQNSMQMTNGIPPQQRPALGFFSNQASSEKKILHDITTTSQSYVPESSKDSFSQALTPVNTLPPPRLPSIQFPGTVAAESANIEGVGKAQKPSVPKQEKSTGNTVSSIMSILNNDDNKQSYSSPLALPSTSRVPHFNQLQHNQPTSAIRPHIGNVVVQELQKSSSSSPEDRRSSSISSLLNPESQKAIRGQPPPTIAHRTLDKGPLPPPPTVSQVQQANFNFAVDPLGALAAIASESLLPTKNGENQSCKR